MSQRSTLPLPLLLFATSIILPIFGLANSIDIFYFGLCKSSAIAFTSALIFTAVYTFAISLYWTNSIIRLLLSLLALLLVTAVFNLVPTLSNNSELIIKPTIASGARSMEVEELLFFLFSGWVFGNLIGFGTGGYFDLLRRANLSKIVSVLVSITVATIVVIIGINSLVLGSFALTIGLIWLELLIPIALSLRFRNMS